MEGRITTEEHRSAAKDTEAHRKIRVPNGAADQQTDEDTEAHSRIRVSPPNDDEDTVGHMPYRLSVLTDTARPSDPDHPKVAD